MNSSTFPDFISQVLCPAYIERIGCDEYPQTLPHHGRCIHAGQLRALAQVLQAISFTSSVFCK